MATKKEITALFDQLGVELSLDSFDERKKIQKLVYLSEALGVDMGFTFTWYIWGPYSPDLTKVMFDKERGTSSNFKTSSGILNKIAKLKNMLGVDIESSDNLELIASLHYIFSIAKTTEISEKNALELFYAEKPQFTKEEVRKYLPKVKEII